MYQLTVRSNCTLPFYCCRWWACEWKTCPIF